MKFRAVAFLIAMALPNSSPIAALAATCDPEIALFEGRDGQVRVNVEIADTPETRARGLMFRKYLPPGHGMIFIYEEPSSVGFWMRNTLIPLDMIFVDKQGRVRHIHPDARPLDETVVHGAVPGDPDPERLIVVEVAGGEAARLGLTPGMVLAHPGLPQKLALIPCE